MKNSSNPFLLGRFNEIERDNKHLLNKMKEILTNDSKFSVQDKVIRSMTHHYLFSRLAYQEEHPARWLQKERTRAYNQGELQYSKKNSGKINPNSMSSAGKWNERKRKDY